MQREVAEKYCRLILLRDRQCHFIRSILSQIYKSKKVTDRQAYAIKVYMDKVGIEITGRLKSEY